MTTYDARHLSAMTIYACDLAAAYPTAQAVQIADKLFTVFPASPWPARIEVASTAIRAVAAAQEAA